MSFEDKKAAYAKAVADLVFLWKDPTVMGSSKRTWDTFEKAVAALPDHSIAPNGGPGRRALQKWRTGETPEPGLALRAIMAIGFAQESAFETLNKIRRDVGLSPFTETAEDLLNPPARETDSTSVQDSEGEESDHQCGHLKGDNGAPGGAKRSGSRTRALILGALLCVAALGLIVAGDGIFQIGATNIIGDGNEVNK